MDPFNADLIKQNTIGHSEGFPVGVPPSYSWYQGWNYGGQMPPPEGFTAVEGWGQVYQEVGAPDYFNPYATVEIANAKTYVHVKQTSTWLLVQDQSKLQMTGGHFVPDFAGNVAIPMKVIPLPGAHTAFGAPPPGYNNHFWYGSRGTYAAGTVDAVYVQMDMRVSDPNLRLIGMVGADWWRDASAPYLDDHSNNPGIGGTNWIRLSTEWKTIGYYSMSTERFQSNLPPALSGAGASSPSSVTIAPAPPKFSLSSLDTGVVGSVTTSRFLELTGTAEAGSTVTIFDGAKQIGTAMTSADGAWRFTTPKLSKSDHYFTARTTDAEGNTSSASSMLNIKVVDPTPILSPTPAGDKPLNKGTLDALEERGERLGMKGNDGSHKAGQALTERRDHFAAVGAQPEHDRPNYPVAEVLSGSFILLPILLSAMMTTPKRHA